jgi:hypothetical protein
VRVYGCLPSPLCIICTGISVKPCGQTAQLSFETDFHLRELISGFHDAMSKALVCWKCGAALTDQPLPLSRLAECSKCRAYLHVCRMCVSFDSHLTRKCREQDAEEVTEKERTNFCGYFKARPDAYRPGGEARSLAARAKLGDLFSANDKIGQETES